ncbi:TetR/AcrR family transcriptional regulator [Actinoplanes sp. CA-131856]
MKEPPSAQAARDSDRAARRTDQIADAALEVFLRYGYRKTSMDDVAEAAGLSRQGLYLHYANKEELFHGVLRRLASRLLDLVKAALSGAGKTERERLFAAFEVIYDEGTTLNSGRATELFATAAELGPSLVTDMQQGVVTAVAAALRDAGVEDQWRPLHITADQLATHLLATAHGLVQMMPDKDHFVQHMQTAISIVTDIPQRP